MSDDKKDLKKFYDQVGEFYPEEEAVYQTLRGMLRKRFVLDWLTHQRGALLEIGTNRGMYLQHYDGGRRIGIDLSQPVLKQAHRQKPVDYAVADAERLQCFKANSFDRVLCSEVIEHCFRPEDIFRSIEYVLKPGGSALITTPNFKGERPTWVELGSMIGYGVKGAWQEKYFHTAYHPEELVELAQNAGLDVLLAGTLEKEIKYIGKIPAVMLHAGRALNKIIRSQTFGQWNEDFFHHFCLFIYGMTRNTVLERFMLSRVKVGARSFIIVRKAIR